MAVAEPADHQVLGSALAVRVELDGPEELFQVHCLELVRDQSGVRRVGLFDGVNQCDGGGEHRGALFGDTGVVAFRVLGVEVRRVPFRDGSGAVAALVPRRHPDDVLSLPVVLVLNHVGVRRRGDRRGHRCRVRRPVQHLHALDHLQPNLVEDAAQDHVGPDVLQRLELALHDRVVGTAIDTDRDRAAVVCRRRVSVNQAAQEAVVGIGRGQVAPSIVEVGLGAGARINTERVGNLRVLDS